jgi:hypothetical protein
MSLNPKALEARGVKIQYDEVWVGEPGKGKGRRPKPVLSKVRGVYLALTPEEWCRIAMRDGDMYMGGCCGTTSAMQDVVNGVFRDSGYANANTLCELGMYAKQHPDGFDGFNVKLSQADFDKQCRQWSKLDPWTKISLCWQAVKGKVSAGSEGEPIVQENRPDLDEKREIDELYGALTTFRYKIFMPREKEDDPLKPPKGQSHANDVLTWAKMVPGTKRLLAKLEEDFTTWSGYAVVERARPEVVCHNGYGLCLFTKEADAEELVADWRKNSRAGKGENTADKVRIRAVTVSVQKGLEFTS